MIERREPCIHATPFPGMDQVNKETSDFGSTWPCDLIPASK